MDVVNAISCVFLFMAAGPFLEKLFLTFILVIGSTLTRRSARDATALAAANVLWSRLALVH
jgi:hypothetical protein